MSQPAFVQHGNPYPIQQQQPMSHNPGAVPLSGDASLQNVAMPGLHPNQAGGPMLSPPHQHPAVTPSHPMAYFPTQGFNSNGVPAYYGAPQQVPAAPHVCPPPPYGGQLAAGGGPLYHAPNAVPYAGGSFGTNANSTTNTMNMSGSSYPPHQQRSPNTSTAGYAYPIPGLTVPLQAVPQQTGPTTPMHSATLNTSTSNNSVSVPPAMHLNNSSSSLRNAPQPDPATCSNVFVASLPNFYDDKMLFELFQPFGNIVSAKVSRDLVTGNSRSFGFVRFELPSAAQAAINGLHSAKVKGAGTSRLHVTLSSHSENESAAESDRLYIRNLPLTATTEQLIAIFSPFGTVAEVNIHGNSQQSGRGNANLAVGFVRMSTVAEARRALSGIHNTRPLDPDSPLLVRFMETPDMKAARRSKPTPENASGRNSVNRNSPDHLAGSTSSRPGSPHGTGQPSPPAYHTVAQGNNPPSIAAPAPSVPISFPAYGDLRLFGANSEAIARYVFTYSGLTVAQMATDGVSYIVRLTDPLLHDKAVGDLNGVGLSDGNTLAVYVMYPPQPQVTVAAQPPVPVMSMQHPAVASSTLSPALVTPPQSTGIPMQFTS